MINLYNLWCKIKRFFYWGWKLRNSYDWDHSYFYEIIYLKLDSMYRYLTTYGICVSSNKNSNLMKKLLEASNLAKSLSDESFEYSYNPFDNSFVGHKRSDKIRAAQKKRLFYLLEKYTDHLWD